MDTSNKLQQIVNKLYPIKILADTGSVSYSGDDFKHPNILQFETSNEFKDYIRELKEETNNPYDNQESKSFIEGLAQIYKNYGYNFDSNVKDNTIVIEPLKQIQDILKDYSDTLDMSKLGLSVLRVNSNLWHKDASYLIVNDIFIDESVENKFMNAVQATWDIANYLNDFADSGDEAADFTNGRTILDGLYYDSGRIIWNIINLNRNASDGFDVKLYDYLEPDPILRKNKLVSEDSYDMNVIKEVIINKFKYIAKQYLPNFESLQETVLVKKISKFEIVFQIEALFGKNDLRKISNVMYKHL